MLVRWVSLVRHALQRPHENGRSLDDSDREKQQDENAERERNGDRALPAALLLSLGEDNSVWLVVVGHRLAMRLTRSRGEWRGSRPRSKGSQTAQTDRGSRTRTAGAWRAQLQRPREGGRH